MTGDAADGRPVRRAAVLRWLERWFVPSAQVSVWTEEPDVLHTPRPEASDVAGNLWWRAVWFAGPGHVYDPSNGRGRVTPAWSPPLASGGGRRGG